MRKICYLELHSQAPCDECIQDHMESHPQRCGMPKICQHHDSHHEKPSSTGNLPPIIDKITTECEENCHLHPHHYFDYIGGSGSGSLAAVMLGRLHLSVPDAMEEFIQIMEDVFGHPRLGSMRGPIPWLQGKYSQKRLGKAVKDMTYRQLRRAEAMVGAGSFQSLPGLCRT